MNPSFIISPTDLDTSAADLYIEIKPQGLSYIIIEGNQCRAVANYQFKPATTAESAVGFIHEILAAQPFLQQEFKKVQVIYCYAQAVLVPHAFIEKDNKKEMLDLVFGDIGETEMMTDFIYQHGIHNVYRIPAVVQATMLRYFEKAVFSHLFSLLPFIVDSSGSRLFCIFNPGLLTVYLQKDARLQGIQSFAYSMPEDAAYYLLNICNNFDVAVNNLPVHLTGMIDTSSALYNEMYKYFSNLHFETLPQAFQYPEEVNQYPAHYFSHLFAIASCV